MSHRAAEDLAAIEELTVQRKDLDDAIRAAKARVMEEMGALPAGSCEGWRVSWKPQTRNSIDGAALKRDYPEIYQKYSKQTSSRVFRLTKIKEEKAS